MDDFKILKMKQYSNIFPDTYKPVYFPFLADFPTTLAVDATPPIPPRRNFKYVMKKPAVASENLIFWE